MVKVYPQSGMGVYLEVGNSCFDLLRELQYLLINALNWEYSMRMYKNTKIYNLQEWNTEKNWQTHGDEENDPPAC